MPVSLTPGPGNYEPKPISLSQSKPILGGKDKKIDEPDKDNGVPGPGMYEYEAQTKSVPSFVIMKPQFRSKTRLEQVKDPVGPWKYQPQFPGETYKG